MLIAANLIPLYGVFRQSWTVFPLIFLFWMENLVIGALNVPQMLFASPFDRKTWIAKLLMIPFFCFHYGVFALGHGFFVLLIFGRPSMGRMVLPTPALIARVIREEKLEWALIALAMSHVFSVGWNYFRNREYLATSLEKLMVAPYSRVIILHVTLILGGFLVMTFNSPLVGLILFVIVKTVVDARMHIREHPQAGKSTYTLEM